MNPYDGTAAQVVPQNVEKLPLFHWRPGARALCVGSRDGAAFDGQIDPSEERTFRRPLSAELLARSHSQVGTDAVAAAWSGSLHYPEGLGLLQTVAAPLIVIGAGEGDPSLVPGLLDNVAAWVLLIDDVARPLQPVIAAEGAHVEVLWGLTGVPATLPELDWDHVAACHLTPRSATMAVGAELEDWEVRARELIAGRCPVYGAADKHSVCSCGETLVWRHAGRSRIDTLQPDGTCSVCGARHHFIQ